MAKVSKDVLKLFFQTGRTPSSANFSSLIESLLHEDERDTLGLRNYNPLRTYASGDTAIYNGEIYQATQSTTGNFVAESWHKITVGSEAPGEAPAPAAMPVFGSDYELATAKGQSLKTDPEFAVKLSLNTGSRKGRYRIQWWAVAGLDNENIGHYRFMNGTTGDRLGATLTCQGTSAMQKLPVGGVEVMELNGNSIQLEVQYAAHENGMTVYIEEAGIEIYRIS